MNTSVEIRSGRFTVIDDPEENGQSTPLNNSDNQPVPTAQPLIEVVSAASSASSFSPSDRTSPSSAYDGSTPQHAYSTMTPTDGGPHSIGPYSSQVNNELYTLSDVAPPSLYRGSSESSATGRQTMSTSPNGSDESSQSSQSTGYGDESSPSGANNNEAESGSPLSGAAMRRSGRFTVIDDEDNGVSGGSERVEVDSHGQRMGDSSMQYDRVQSVPDEQRSASAGNEQYMDHAQQSDSYAELLRRQQLHSDDPELIGGGQQEHARRMATGDVEQVYEPHHTHSHTQHGQEHMQQQQTHHSSAYEQPPQHHEQYEQQQQSDYDQQHYQQQQYEQSQYEQQQQQQAYDQQQYEQEQQYEQQQQQQQQQFEQQQYEQQQYEPNSSPQHYDQEPHSQHVTYADEQQSSAYPTDDPNNTTGHQTQHYNNTSTLYEEQAGSPSPLQGDQYGDTQSGGLDLDALASECGPLNLFNMLYSQVAKVMEENEWLKQENVQLRDENYDLQSRLAYVLQQLPPNAADTPSVLSSSASPEYQSPHHSPSRLTRSVTTDPQHHLNTTSSSHYSDETLTKTAPIRSVTELMHNRPSHVGLPPQSTPSPSPNVERVDGEDGGSKVGGTSGVEADGGEVEHSPAANGMPSPHSLSIGSSTLSRPTSALAHFSSSSLNGAGRTSSANGLASSVSPSPVGSASSTLSTSASSSPIHAASKQTKRKPSVSIKAGELSPSKGSTLASLSSTLPALPSATFASNSSPAASNSSALPAPRKTSLSTTSKVPSPANAAAPTNGVKKAGPVTPRKKSITAAPGKTASASKSNNKGNFFTAASGGSDPLDQFLSQAVSGLSGLCSTTALNGKNNTSSSTSTTADKSKPSANTTSNSNSNSSNNDASSKKDTRNNSAASSASNRDAINVLAASLHLKPKERDKQQHAEGHSPGVSGGSGSSDGKAGDSKSGGKGGGVLDDLKPSFGVGSGKPKHDSDNLFL